MRIISILILSLLLYGCGGGSATSQEEQRQAPISGSGHPSNVVPNDEPPKPPGTPTGNSVPLQLTITSSKQFDVYAWNDALSVYTFFWQFDGGTETIEVLYTPNKAHEIHIDTGINSWTRYDLIAGDTALTVSP